MNSLTNVKNIKKLTETELKLNVSGKASRHNQYKNSAWVFIGGLPYDLSEGDVISLFSEYGEVVNLNLVRDKVTGKSKGFCFLCYEEQRSTVLVVDNLNSIKVCGRTLRVDHVEQYKVPENIDKRDEEALQILYEGCGPNSNVLKTLTNEARTLQPTLSTSAEENDSLVPTSRQAREIEMPTSSETKLKKSSKSKSKKNSRSRSPKYRKGSDRRRSPNADRKHSPSRERRHSPRREQKHSSKRKPRYSPSRERRSSLIREPRYSPNRGRRHSPCRKQRILLSWER